MLQLATSNTGNQFFSSYRNWFFAEKLIVFQREILIENRIKIAFYSTEDRNCKMLRLLDSRHCDYFANQVRTPQENQFFLNFFCIIREYVFSKYFNSPFQWIDVHFVCSAANMKVVQNFPRMNLKHSTFMLFWNSYTEFLAKFRKIQTKSEFLKCHFLYGKTTCWIECSFEMGISY